MRILVADDDADVCSLLERALVPPFEVTTVHDASRAVELAADDAFALIITDALLPGASSLQLIRAIRARPRRSPLPILMLSGRVSRAPDAGAVAAEADAVLEKPFTLKALRATVRALVAAS
jgi:DNA-binding response OmpR family regulator